MALQDLFRSRYHIYDYIFGISLVPGICRHIPQGVKAMVQVRQQVVQTLGNRRMAEIQSNNLLQQDNMIGVNPGQAQQFFILHEFLDGFQHTLELLDPVQEGFQGTASQTGAGCAGE